MAGPAPHRQVLNLSLDALLAAVALPVTVLLAGPGAGPAPSGWGGGLLLAMLTMLPPAWAFGLYRQYWRFAGLRDMLAVLAAAVVAAASFAGVQWALGLWRPSNPAFPILHVMVLTGLLGAPRLLARAWALGRARAEAGQLPPVLVVGSADQVDLFIHALGRQRRPPFRVMGILARRPRQTGRLIQGHPILGAMEEAEPVLERLRAEGRLPALIVLASNDIGGPALRALLDAADRQGVGVRAAPEPTALREAARSGEDAPRLDLRPVSIEELLDRPQVPLDREGMARLIQGRRVLVTGAGGTIGGELARQVAALGPAMLTLLDHGEFALYAIDLELSERDPAVPRRAVLADIRDEARLKRLMEDIRPELVFHAAALKHVPMVERDPLEGVLTNAHGTRLVAEAARAAGCRLMVFISTDKAVNPTSVMGATKRLAEMYCQALDKQARAGDGPPGEQRMRCITVRFGNVLGSTGSVVPLFRRQLERGGPLTVTHPDMRRYFMTVREAVGLVLQAAVVGSGEHAPAPAGEGLADVGSALREGGIFVLDMGEPMKIVELARRMISLAGLRPDEDIEIRFTGLRPGEKLFEELFHGQEPPRRTPYAGLLVATPRTADVALVGRALDEIAASARGGQVRLALAQLARLVPEFEHNADGAAGAQAR
ncbi:MAG: polysaccharide biosynthesis protein [Rubritepida sp.]|nr:polysaccharide biosynthesis protein [Rubritepida sp.]